MIAQSGPALYRLNLIRDLRENEKKAERQQRMAIILGFGCFGFFILSLLYSTLTIWQMESVLATEKRKVAYLGQEYRKYTSSNLIVDKGDIELLSGLQSKGIFWTKKLAAIAKHLPDNYWITRFTYHDNELQVIGGGYASPQQDQLLILDDYLNKLRADTSFSDTFKKLQLTIADRREESAGSARIAFQFSAYTSKWSRK